MGKLGMFNFISLNGYYKGLDEDIRWHKHERDETGFSEENLEKDNILLFGRVTYEMMYAFWPTSHAMELMPVVAEGMNKAEKIVFSRTMNKAEWNNTRVVHGNMAEEVRKMKQGSKDMVILGSGSIVTQLADEGLIDEYQIMISPVVISDGVPIFKDIKHQLNLKLISTRTFKSGAVVLTYEPVAK